MIQDTATSSAPSGQCRDRRDLGASEQDCRKILLSLPCRHTRGRRGQCRRIHDRRQSAQENEQPAGTQASAGATGSGNHGDREAVGEVKEGIEGVRNQMIESQDKLDELRKAGDDKRIEEQQVAGDRKRLEHERATSSNKPSWQARRRAVKRRKPKRFRQAVNARRSCCPSWRRKRNQPIWRSKPQNLPVKLMSRRRKSFRVS